MLLIPVNRVEDKKRIVRKNGGPRRRRGPLKKYWSCLCFLKIVPYSLAGFDLTTHYSEYKNSLYSLAFRYKLI
jgi:hypothetical protein